MTPFGTLPDGREVRGITIGRGALRVSVIDLGAIVQDVRLEGVDHPLVLGGAGAAAYTGIMSHFGAVIGPVANRIAGASAVIDGRTCTFEPNEGGHTTCHSGSAGAHLKVWQIEETGPDHVVLAVDLPDGEGGFPGNRRLRARYETDGATLTVTLGARTDATTLVNLAHHPYWALQPAERGWEGMRLTIAADYYLPVDARLVPTGEIAPVDGTPFDFRRPRTLSQEAGPNLDHNFCLARAAGPMAPAARLDAPSGPTLDIATTAPGLQVFDMAPFGVTEPTVHGHPYAPRAGIALEPQLWPDAPGRSGWPDITLAPAEVFEQATRYTFRAPVP